MMHGNGHRAHPQQWQQRGQQAYRTHDFRAPPPPPTWQQQQQQMQMQQQQMQMQQMQQQQQQMRQQQMQMQQPPLMPAPPVPVRQATCGATAMSGMTIKQESGSDCHPRSGGRNEPPKDLDPEDLEAANEVVEGLVAMPWKRVKVTLEDEEKKKRFHEAVQVVWSATMFHSRRSGDIKIFDAATRHLRNTCIDHFPDPLKELTSVCPGLTVMEHPKGNTSPDGAEAYRLYYGFDFDGGKNFYSIATVDIQPREYGFDVVNVHRVGFRMVEKASSGDRTRYELELASGLYAYNQNLFKKNKELRGAIGKKKSKPSKQAYEVLMHEAQARM